MGFRRKPDFVIGDPANPYLLRWYVIPRNKVFNIYLHKFCKWAPTLNRHIGGRAFRICEVHDYAASNEVEACLKGIGEARARLEAKR